MVEIRQYDKSSIKNIDVINGVSPTLLKRVFIGWLVFACIVEAIVFTAPKLGETFVNVTTASLLLFTLLLWLQSRLTEGWPSIIHDNGALGVVIDPTSRKFLCASLDVVETAKPAIVKPNKKAVEISLNTQALTDNDMARLNEAVWPRESALVGLCHFEEPSEVCKALVRFKR